MVLAAQMYKLIDFVIKEDSPRSYEAPRREASPVMQSPATATVGPPLYGAEEDRRRVSH